jgi:hypothetical protein
MRKLRADKIRFKNVNIETHQSITFLVVLCGCETLLLILREEHRPRMFENGVPRRMLWN